MKIQNVLKALGDTGCLMLCYAELAKVPLIDVINNFSKLVLNKAIRDDCFVLDADKYLHLLGSDKKVKKVNIADVAPGTPYIALWENDGNGHFVIMQDDKVIYNTLEKSYCVAYGKMNPIVRIVE